jgi:1,2-phenylacetyl-CoA epoxidase PaaB subunit
MFDYYWSEMARIQVCRLAYHVIYFGESALAQMDSLFKILGSQSDWEHDRIVIDLEVAGVNTKARITATTQKCLDICKSRTGRYPICYSSAYWVNSNLSVSQLPRVDWWLAAYRKALPYPFFTPEHEGPPNLPAGVTTYLIHQTGENTKGIGSVSRYMDYDRWNGDKAEVLRYFNNPNYLNPPGQNPPQGLFRARCLVSALYTREGPGLNYKVVGSLSMGDEVDVYEVKNSWFRIDPTASIWCSGKTDYMRQIDPNQRSAELFKAKVIVSALYKRKGPGKNYDICGYLEKNAIVSVYEVKNNWYRIDPYDQIWSCGETQYMNKV